MEKLEPVPDKLRALLDEEKASGEPSGGARERVLLRLAGTFALGAPGGLSPETGPNGPPSPAPRASSRAPDVIQAARLAPAARAVRAAVLFVTGAATGVGGYHVVERARHRAPVSAPLSVPSSRPEIPPPPEMPKPTTPDVPEPVPGATGMPPRPRASAAAETAPATSSRPDDPLAAERSLLEMARAALGRGQADRALAALRRHARQFPNGELTEEREGLLVQSLVGAQKYDQAREKADQFKKRYPRSLFAPVVDQAIGSIP
jgi:hypothetical protein